MWRLDRYQNRPWHVVGSSTRWTTTGTSKGEPVSKGLCWEHNPAQRTRKCRVHPWMEMDSIHLRALHILHAHIFCKIKFQLYVIQKMQWLLLTWLSTKQEVTKGCSIQRNQIKELEHSEVYIRELVACVCMRTQTLTIKRPYCSILSKQKNELGFEAMNS